ncbi:MAG: ABC transporter substrate-binding protein [Candidatus Tectimicrobiota bacterium]
MQRQTSLHVWTAATLLLLWAFSVPDIPAAPMRHYRVALFHTDGANDPLLEGLREELAKLGYVAGKNVTFLTEKAQHKELDIVQRATLLAATQPDVLVTVGTIYTTAAHQATQQVPIVFSYVGDPLRSGLIASYASSQNNLTGVSVYSGPLSGKRLEVLLDIAPNVTRILSPVAVRESIAESAFQNLEETAIPLGIQVLRHNVTSRAEVAQLLRDTPAEAVDALYLIPSGLMVSCVDLLIQKAMQAQLPLMVHEDSLVERGALASYGASFRRMGQQTARLVAKVLQGSKPREIPVQTPDTLLLTLNLATAKAIGLRFPPGIVERADRMVE